MNDPFIRLGSRVILPDNSIAHVTRSRPRVGESDDGTVEVTHHESRTGRAGRGPWKFHRSQLRLAPPNQPAPEEPSMADQLAELRELDPDAFDRVVRCIEDALAEGGSR